MRTALWIALPLLAAACGDDDDECGAETVALQVTVDGRAPSECASWALFVRVCSTGGGCDFACPCVDGAPDPTCDPLVDACDESTVELPPGDYQVRVTAELVNGGISFDSDVAASVGGGSAIAADVVTEDAFPCIRDWEFNGSQCCNDVVGACVPPGE
jgi:hypothetical protein